VAFGMVTFINEVTEMIIEEYISRLAIQKRVRGLNTPRGI